VQAETEAVKQLITYLNKVLNVAMVALGWM
jgi:hypothetical protein